MASNGAAAAHTAKMEPAWHLLTVLVRLGRPATPSNLAAAAANYVSPDYVERVCHIDGSPLRISGSGVVKPSETAIRAFRMFVGIDVPAPSEELKPPEVRRRAFRRFVGIDVPAPSEELKPPEVRRRAFRRFVGIDVPAPSEELKPPEVRRRCGEVIRYVRKRKVSDASCSSAKRLQLPAPDADLVEQSEHESNQLVAQTCAPAATEEVRLEVMQELLDGFHTRSTFIGESSLGFSTRATLVPSVPKVTTIYIQPQVEESLRGDDDTVPRNMASALVPTDLSDCSVNLPPLHAVKLKNINGEVDGKSSRIGESEQVLFPHCRVEHSDDPQKKTVLPTFSHALLVRESKNEIEEDLNLVRKNPGSPINYNKTADSMEASDMIPNQADALQNNCPKSVHHENVPTCHQEKDPGANAYAEACKDNTTHILFQPPMDTEVGSMTPQMDRNVEPEPLLQEVTRYECSMDVKNPNITAENRESKYLSHEEQPLNEAEVSVSKNRQDRIVVKQKEKSKKNELPKEDKDRFAAKVQKGNVVPKPLPSFKGFVIEEEEGSGGYGTVYRAWRKKDERIFAIKCPHPNAHSHHVNNELKVLERFGGKNYVIKYECSLKSGDLECFVLEHVDHDRPEILKKDIALLELQWYGYCLFRALASLHKQGVVHRDVKPGNFLFCRKLKKGYLIDFNLANNLHQKFLKTSKSETITCGKDTASQTLSTSAPVVHAKEAAAGSKQPLPLKRKRSSTSPVDSAPKIDIKSRHGSQAADVSGVTSAKDPTSTKTSLDRLKQPMPYKGRKELMNFLHEAMQSPNKNTAPAPASQRKRVAAPLGNVDRKLFKLTPMPLRSGGSAVAGSGTLNKGHGKHRREGPCVGTKGFRAPEVLFRSFHQGCKVDVWSAGVTLLYLIIGRTPFGGDPEQNIKEIAKLKGSEELWEVAKLHNCESSYPSDLFDVKSFHSVDLKEWCAANTRRPEFFKMIPDSLFDLVYKCLAVNPRCRLTSDDALKHELFAPCREARDSLRKQMMLRRPGGSVAACSSSHQNTALTAEQS